MMLQRWIKLSLEPLPENLDSFSQETALQLGVCVIKKDPVRAAVQLCASLTKRHDFALKFLQDGCLKHLVTEYEFPSYETEAAVLIRHLLEDPSTLQAAMELEIGQLFQYMRTFRPESFIWNFVWEFVKKMAPIISRDPTVFMEAVISTCELDLWDTEQEYLDLDEASLVLSNDKKEPEKTVPAHFTTVFHELIEILLNISCGAEGFICDDELKQLGRARFILKVLGDSIVIHVHAIRVFLDYDEELLKQGRGGLFSEIFSWVCLLEAEANERKEKFFGEASRFVLVVCRRSSEGCSRIRDKLLKYLRDMVDLRDMVSLKRVNFELVNQILGVDKNKSALSRFLQPLIDIIELVDPKDDDAPKRFSYIFKSIDIVCSNNHGDTVDNQSEDLYLCLTDSILFEDGDKDNYFSLRKPLRFEHQYHTSRGFSSRILQTANSDTPDTEEVDSKEFEILYTTVRPDVYVGVVHPQPSNMLVEQQIITKLKQKAEQRSQLTQEQVDNLVLHPVPTQEEKNPLSFDNMKSILKPLLTCQELELKSIQNLLHTLSLHRDTRAYLVQILLNVIRPTIQTSDHPLLMRVLDVLTPVVKEHPTVLDTFLVSSQWSGCEGKGNEKFMGGEIPVFFMKLLNPPQNLERSIDQLELVMQLLQSVFNRVTSLTEGWSPPGDLEGRKRSPHECQILSQLSQSDLENLCSLLGREGLTDDIYSLAKDVLKKLGRIHMPHQDFFCQTLLQMAGNLSKNIPEESQTVNGLLDVLSALTEEDDILKSMNLKLEPFCNSLSECIRHLQWEARWFFPLIKLFFYLSEKIQPSIEESHENAMYTFFKFAEDHKKLLNEIIREDLDLLHNSFSLMLKTPWLIDLSNKKTYLGKMMMDKREVAKLQICVRRKHVFEDSYNQLHCRSPKELLGDLRVMFDGEKGLDGGGLTRDWYQLMSEAITSNTSSMKLFTAVETEITYQPNPNSCADLSYYRFIGHMLAKALLDEHLVDFELTPSFYKHILGAEVTYADMKGLDSKLYMSLNWFLENDVESLGMTFTDHANGEDYDLKVNGRDIEVTEANKEEYVTLKATYRMTTAIQNQLGEFLKGFYELIPQKLVSIFSHEELKLLMSGMPNIDVNALKDHSTYGEGYTENSPVIQWLWEVLSSFDKQDVARFLGFVTGTPRVPSQGFVNLQIDRVGTSDRLPSSHTCANTIDIPEYSSKEILKDKLLKAVQEYQGFDFI